MPDQLPDTPEKSTTAEYSTGKRPLSRSSVAINQLQRQRVMTIVFGLIAGLVGAYIFIHFFAGAIPTDRKQLVVQETSAVTDVVKKVSPSVVSITTQQLAAGFFGTTQVEGAGTGMIVTADGLILTNKHVVPAGVSSVTVVMSDGKQYPGSVVSRDAVNDIAFVRISAKNLTPVVLGDSGAVQVGEKVVAIGNALGQFQNSVTEGIISGVSRQIVAGDQGGSDSETLQNVFQTDAAINSGNSGGPLVNLDGQVIAMNTAVASQGAQNIGFAIPINDIKSDIISVKSKGVIERPYLGVRFVPLTKDVATANNLSVTDGAWLQGDAANPSVVPGSPADKAGLKDGDIITKVADTKIDSTHSLPTLVSQHKIGDKVTLTVLRDGKTQTVTVTLESAPSGQ
jgi:serine protease Do